MSEMAIAIANVKGGVGKTTLSIILTELALFRGKKVLAIDLDPQRNFSDGLLYLGNYFKNTLRVKKNLEPERDAKAPEDLVILDCPPSMSDRVREAMSFADMVLVPIRPDVFSIVNLNVIYKTVNLDKNNQKAKNQFPIVKLGFDNSKIARHVEELLYDCEYPIIGELPLLKHIPYNIARGNIWSVGLTATQREYYNAILRKIENAVQVIKDTGKFEEAWGNESVEENYYYDEDEDEAVESGSDFEAGSEKQKFPGNRFLGK